ncbi:MAG: ATP-binding protein [Actinomycetota bacterium]
MKPSDRLRTVPLFAALTDDDLDRLCRDAEEIRLGAGDRLFAEGDRGDRAFVISDGDVEIVKQSPGRDVLLAVRHPGEVIGEMALLEDAPRMASARARTDATLITIEKRQLDALLDTSSSAARAMFDVLLSRWRQTEARLRQADKMAQLGTLTAGLAHELNNPAAAVARAAGDLSGAIEEYAGAAHAAAEAGVPPPVAALLDRIRAGASGSTQLGALERADAESAVESWLEGRSVAEPGRGAGPLVAAGLDPAALDDLAITGPAVEAMVSLIVASVTVGDLVRQVNLGAQRVFEIVRAMKSYAFLDRAPVQDVNIATGIDDTLLLLGSKLRDVTVVRDYADLPPVPAYGSELNQVWTNLIDNAIDAITEGGGTTITVRTRVEGPLAVVEVEDDGPGIPPEVLPRVFDAFYTTKAPGKGTGQGLDISYGIVVHRHGGDIRVTETHPGRTVFRVEIPLAGPPS